MNVDLHLGSEEALGDVGLIDICTALSLHSRSSASPCCEALHGCPCNVIVSCIVLYCVVLYCMVLYCIALYCIALHWIVLYCIVLHCMVWYGMVWYGMVWYGMVWYGIVLYGLISCSVTFCSIPISLHSCQSLIECEKGPHLACRAQFCPKPYAPHPKKNKLRRALNEAFFRRCGAGGVQRGAL